MGFFSKTSGTPAGEESSRSAHGAARVNGMPGKLPSPNLLPLSPVDVLVQTLWAVAWGENLRGQEAIASLIFNRTQYVTEQQPRQMTQSLVLVCRALQHQVQAEGERVPAWAGSALANDALVGTIPHTTCTRTTFQGNLIQEASREMCRRVARRLIAGRLTDVTGGARHYHHAGDHPLWAWKQIPSAIIGDLMFYNF